LAVAENRALIARRRRSIVSREDPPVWAARMRDPALRAAIAHSRGR